MVSRLSHGQRLWRPPIALVSEFITLYGSSIPLQILDSTSHKPQTLSSHGSILPILHLYAYRNFVTGGVTEEACQILISNRLDVDRRVPCGQCV